MNRRVSDPQEVKVFGWTLKKEVSLGDIIAFIAACAGVVAAYVTLHERLLKLEEFKAYQLVRDAEQDNASNSAKRDVVQRLDRIEDKLDRVIERRPMR